MSFSILICDDASFIRMVIKDVLEKNNYNVIGEASTGIEAIEKYNKLKPDLILLDITMPVMNGIEALKQILYTNPTAKIIMFSTTGQQEEVLEAMNIGAKDVLIKPFQANTLLSTIKKILALS